LIAGSAAVRSGTGRGWFAPYSDRAGVTRNLQTTALKALHMPVRMKMKDVLVVLAAVREAQTVMDQYDLLQRNPGRTLRHLRNLLTDRKLIHAINRLSLMVESPSTVPEEMTTSLTELHNVMRETARRRTA
jgi:hypothetical protein